MERKQIRFGLIGLGMMGKEFASAAARWCHLIDDGPVPVITGICNRKSREDRDWFTENFPTIEIVTDDYRKLLSSEGIDAIYCAVPHHLHEKIYIDTIRAGKHLLGEKPFGIDKKANDNILQTAKENPDLVVRCSSQLPYLPGAKMVIDWIRAKTHGRLMEVKCGFHHSSDMDLNKPINWKRMIQFNGEYGCMGDLGFHTMFVPLRMGWVPQAVYADLQNIAETRPDGKGGLAPCMTWDNAVLTCRASDPATGKDFSLVFEMKRMAPGQTNTWFIEVYGTAGSVRYTTHDPKALFTLKTTGKEQAWCRLDIGSKSFLPTITPPIFEVGFSDAILQMVGALMQEFRPEGSGHPFPPASVQETSLHHAILSAALESNQSGTRVNIGYADNLPPTS